MIYERISDCDGACHTYCAHLDSIPEGEWFCSSCTAQRTRATRRRCASQQRQAEERSRRRQKRTVIISDDEEDEEMQIVENRSGRHINRRQRNGIDIGDGVEARTSGGNTNNRTNRDLEGFIVSDSEEESTKEEQEEEELPLEERLRRRGGGGDGGGNARRPQRQRHDRSVRDALNIEKDEDLDLDSPAVVSGAIERKGGWRRVRREVNINNSGTTSTRRTASRNYNRRSRNTASRQLRHQQQQPPPSIQDDDVSPATATNWDSLRRGTTSFDQLLDHGGGNNNTKRLRQGREAARARLTAEKEAEDVIDLCESPAAAPPAAGTATTTRPGGLSPPLGITSLSSKLRAELNACKEKGARLPPRKRSIGSGAGAAANNRNANANTPMDAYFAAAAAAATLGNANKNINSNINNSNRGPAPLNKSATPRPSGSALWRRTNNLGSPGSGGPHRMRTVRDVNRSAEVARRTPGSTGGDGRIRTCSSPAPLQQRLAARATAEWGTTITHGGSGRDGWNINNGHASTLPGWHQVKRPELIGKSTTYYPQQQDTHRQFRPRSVANCDPAPHSSTSPKNQRQQQQPEVEEKPECRDIPMFLRKKKETSSIITNSQEQQFSQQVQSPSYSSPFIAVHNNGNTTMPSTNVMAVVKNAKQRAYDAVRSHIRIYLTEEVINRDQYKKIARVATRRLYERHGDAPPDDVPNSQEVALVVDEAMISVIRGEI